jgi:hypothetical protein
VDDRSLACFPAADSAWIVLPGQLAAGVMPGRWHDKPEPFGCCATHTKHPFGNGRRGGWHRASKGSSTLSTQRLNGKSPFAYPPPVLSAALASVPVHRLDQFVLAADLVGEVEGVALQLPAVAGPAAWPGPPARCLGTGPVWRARGMASDPL